MNRATPEPEPTEVELVRRAQRGEPTAFAALVCRYQDRVFNTCYRLCHNHADALDLTQSAFLKALEALHTFDGRSRFYTWLFRIAVNLTLSHRRSRRRAYTSLEQRHGEGRSGGAPADPRTVGVSADIEQKEHRRQVEAALERLDDEFRVAVVLKDIEGLDYSTIAEILNVPIGTVKSRIHRGRLMLRDLLTDEEPSSAAAQTKRT